VHAGLAAKMAVEVFGGKIRLTGKAPANSSNFERKRELAGFSPVNFKFFSQLARDRSIL
jgi:hypothetical protein